MVKCTVGKMNKFHIGYPLQVDERFRDLTQTLAEKTSRIVSGHMQRIQLAKSENSVPTRTETCENQGAAGTEEKRDLIRRIMNE